MLDDDDDDDPSRPLMPACVPDAVRGYAVIGRHTHTRIHLVKMHGATAATLGQLAGMVRSSHGGRSTNEYASEENLLCCVLCAVYRVRARVRASEKCVVRR